MASFSRRDFSSHSIASPVADAETSTGVTNIASSDWFSRKFLGR